MIVFASKDGSHVEAARALAERVGGRFVDRLSNNLEDLRLVARYQVVEPVCIVVVRAGKLAARIPRLVSAEALIADLHRIT